MNSSGGFGSGDPISMMFGGAPGMIPGMGGMDFGGFGAPGMRASNGGGMPR
jgi:hypothetical protein